MSRLTKAFCLMSLCLLAPTLTVASGVHPLFDVQSTTGSPFPTDRFTLTDSAQNTDRRVNPPMPNCAASPSNCGDVALLNQLDGFNIQPRISIPFDGAIDPSTVNNNTVLFDLRRLVPVDDVAYHLVHDHGGVRRVDDLFQGVRNGASLVSGQPRSTEIRSRSSRPRHDDLRLCRSWVLRILTHSDLA